MFLFGRFTRKKEPRIASSAQLESGDVYIGDLVLVTGGCPRYPGDRCELIGDHDSIVCSYKGELYYKIVT